MSDYDRWAADYDFWAREMTEDVGWYVELAQESEGPLVELAVGTGRVAIPVARETGRRVIGIDRSPAMLAEAEKRAAEAGVELDLRLGDMRDLELDEPAELVYCPFRSLLHLPTWHDKRRVFERVAASLRPGGRFAWNAFAFSPFVAARLHDHRETHEGGPWEEIHYAPADNRVDLTRGRGDEELGKVQLWWATKSEWEGLIDVAGLEVEALYGGFRREPFTDESTEFVWVTRKPA
jgi:ubiquinone/menaquinone biosynthesis C-methylase UbiE